LGRRRYIDEIATYLVIKTRNGRKTQDWWFDQKTLTIKARKNNYSIAIESSGRAKRIRAVSTNSNWW
jgi:hypothetical protein